MFTISKASKKRKMLGVFEGGVINIFTGLSPRCRFIISAILYILALGTIGT